MTIAELKQAIEAKKVEARGFTDGKDLENAKKSMEELRNLKETLKIQEELEETEKRDLENQKNEERKGDNKMEKVNEMRTIVRGLMGEELTKEERANIKTVDNSAVVPKQFVNKLQELKKGFGSLKEYADVIPVTKNEGTIPVVDLDQNSFPEVGEGDNIIDGTLVTTDLTFKCKKHGLIQSLTSELVEDAEVEIENLAEKNFVEIVTVAENTKFMKVLKDNATDTAGTTYEDIQLTIDKSLPSVKSGLATYTNTNGYAYLKNLKDSQKRPLNLVTEMNGKYYFHGKELVVVDDTLLAVTEGKNYVFIVANAKEAVKFIDRKAVTLARSTEAGFNDDTIKLRILERFDVIKGSTRSIKKIEF